MSYMPTELCAMHNAFALGNRNKNWEKYRLNFIWGEKKEKKERKKEREQGFEKLLNRSFKGYESKQVYVLMYYASAIFQDFNFFRTRHSFYLFAIEWSAKSITSRNATIQEERRRPESLNPPFISFSSFISSELTTSRERSLIFPELRRRLARRVVQNKLLPHCPN